MIVPNRHPKPPKEQPAMASPHRPHPAFTSPSAPKHPHTGVLTALIACVIFLFIGYAAHPDHTSIARTVITVTVTASPTAVTPGPNRAAIPEDGTYAVGADIPPGVYKANGGAQCTWERLQSVDGTVDAVIATGGSPSQQVVTILPSDAAFQTSGCGLWAEQ